MLNKLRYLLLQIRNADDPMRQQEVDCFARALDCDRDQIRVFDLLAGPPSASDLSHFDMVLIGGAGHYSVAGEGQWLDRALAAMQDLYERSKPTFASCWGFQAISRALGGTVVHDKDRAELGTHPVRLTEAGRADPVFGPLANPFLACMGHEDCVVQLPPQAILLASTQLVPHQAFRIADRPIYCTQFHPELNRDFFLQRIEAYPDYVKYAAGMSVEEFAASCRETPESGTLLRRFVGHVFP